MLRYTVPALALMFSCGSGAPTSEAPPTVAATSAGPGDAARGKATYLSSCTACHNSNPTKAGSVGPEVAGASRELLEARILTGTYPAGYTPKRATTMMAAMPALAGELDHLSAYLSSAR